MKLLRRYNNICETQVDGSVKYSQIHHCRHTANCLLRPSVSSCHGLYLPSQYDEPPIKTKSILNRICYICYNTQFPITPIFPLFWNTCSRVYKAACLILREISLVYPVRHFLKCSMMCSSFIWKLLLKMEISFKFLWNTWLKSKIAKIITCYTIYVCYTWPLFENEAHIKNAGIFI